MRIAFFILITLICMDSFAQGEQYMKVFLNDNFEITDSVNAAFYELTGKTMNDLGGYETKTIFVNGTKYKHGYYDDLNSKSKIGEWTWWYENGQKSQHGEYFANEKSGKWIKWREDGTINNQGSHKNGKETGLWEFHFDNGQISGKVTYENGKIVDETYWNWDGSELMDPRIANQPPTFPGGMEAFYDYIGKNTAYPDIPKKKRKKSVVKVMFIAGREGDIQNVSVIEGLGTEYDQEAVRVVSNMPTWKEGRSFNRPVAVRLVVPITFN